MRGDQKKHPKVRHRGRTAKNVYVFCSVTTQASGAQPCWKTLEDGAECYPWGLLPGTNLWHFKLAQCMWAKRKHVGREEQVLALGCKSIVLNDGCQKDIRGALTVSVVFNNSCLIRLKCCLRLELGAFRSWDRLLWGHDYHEEYKYILYYNTSQPTIYLCGQCSVQLALLGQYSHLWLPWVLAANGL